MECLVVAGDAVLADQLDLELEEEDVVEVAGLECALKIESQLS